MKNDYDFIKDKFDQSEVNAPEAMNKDFALKSIENIGQMPAKKIINFKSVSAAAAIAVFVAVSVFVSSLFIKPATKLTDESSISGIMRFTSREAMRSTLEKTLNKTKEIQNRDIVYEDIQSEGFNYSRNINSAKTAGEGSAGHNSTYVQETGVDEADDVKTDGKYIFYLHNESAIKIFTAEGKNSRLVNTLKAPSNNMAHEFYQYNRVHEFYLYNNKLIVLSPCHSAKNYKTYVKVSVYDVSDINNIRLTDSLIQSGNYCSSRMIGDKLYLVTTHHTSTADDIPRVKHSTAATSDEADIDEIEFDNIYCLKDSGSANFLVVSELNTENSSVKENAKAILGSGEEIYCSQSNLYITAPKYKSAKVPYFTLRIDDIDTEIFKVSLKDNLKFTASGKVKGRIDNQYSMDEKGDFFRIATTSYEDGKDTNNLYVLDKKLRQTGSVTDFAKNEHIEAVRYIGDTAYVITYEQTDPLFIIDLKNPHSPKMLGSVKISGFSTLLVPVDDKTLLGIGYHTEDESYTDMEVQEGVKIVTFDISDKSNPKVKDTKIYKNCESPVQYNPKALIVNPDRRDYTIPLNKYFYDDYDETHYESGTLNFSIDNGKIKIIDRYISQKFRDAQCDRCIYCSDTIYLFSNDYAPSQNNDNLDIMDTVKYK